MIIEKKQKLSDLFDEKISEKKSNEIKEKKKLEIAKSKGSSTFGSVEERGGLHSIQTAP